MHRTPKLKDQARILREAFGAGVASLSQSQALELVARLNGYANWNAACAAEPKPDTPAVTSATPSEVPSKVSLHFWSIVHHHRHGEDVFHMTGERPSREEAIALIEANSEWEPERGESLEILGPDRLDISPDALQAAASGRPTAKLGRALGVLEVNLVDNFDYDTPDELPEWRWISEQCSFVHKENGIGPGIWEEMVLVERGFSSETECPARLKPFFEEAQALGCKWILFYQD